MESLATPSGWPCVTPSERRQAEGVFERLQHDLDADDQLFEMLGSNDTTTRIIAALAAMRLAIFTPHRWAPDDKREGEKPGAKGKKHQPVLTALNAIYIDPAQSPRLRAAVVLAIGEIERHLAGTRMKLILPSDDLCFDPHALELVSWLTRQDEEQRMAALWALSLIAPLLTNHSIARVGRSLADVLRGSANPQIWEAAAKVASGLGKRGGDLSLFTPPSDAPSPARFPSDATPDVRGGALLEALLFRLHEGADEAGVEIVAALKAMRFKDDDTLAAALEKLLDSVADPRRLWLAVLQTCAFRNHHARFGGQLRTLAASKNEHVAKLARDILARPTAPQAPQSPNTAVATVPTPHESALAMV